MSDIEVSAAEEVHPAHADEDPSKIAAMRRTIITSVLVAVPLAIVFFMGMVALAVHGEDPDWTAWLLMAAGIGVIAGVFFGLLFGFMLSSHLFDD